MATNEIRRWIESRRAAERRELEEMADAPPDSRTSVENAFALISLAISLHGWPLPEDEIRSRDDERARDRWARLRAALSAR